MVCFFSIILAYGRICHRKRIGDPDELVVAGSRCTWDMIGTAGREHKY